MSGGFGRVTIPTNLGEFPPVSASAIPHRWLDKTCRPLTVEELHGIVRSFAKIVKDNVSVPVIMAGRVDNPDLALACLEEGSCDMISLGRPTLADPDIVNKIRQDKVKDIRPCISCQEGCMGRIQTYSLINCAVNPEAGKERTNKLNPITEKKRILIVGGGPAGCEAARVLASRGYEVKLCEAGEKLGGNLLPGGAPSFKEDDLALAAWYEHELARLQVNVQYNTRVDAAQIRAEAADVVIFATGSRPKLFSLGDDAHVHAAEDVLLSKVNVGEHVAVVGAGLVGCELALDLAMKGKKVTLVEALDKIMAVNGPICSANKEMLERLLPFNGVEIITGARVKSLADGKLLMEVNGEEQSLPTDDAVLCVGYKSENALCEELRNELPESYVLGDARSVSNIMYAIWDAFEVANHI